MNHFNKEDNTTLDHIIKARHTTRTFTDRIPENEDIEAVINAGRLSPYAFTTVNDVEIFRQFYVIKKGHPLLNTLDKLIQEQTAQALIEFKKDEALDPILKVYGASYERLLTKVSEHGLPNFLKAPCLIIIAEWRGARRFEKQSLSHALENMWLKATALNLGFQPISAFDHMVGNKAFCDLLELPVNHYGFAGCIIGYSAFEKEKQRRFDSSTTWL